MTHTHRNFGRLATSAAIILALFTGTLTVQATAQTSASLSKAELKTLPATPGGHERLAAYYRDKAQRLREKAQKFSDEADYLATQPATIESKQGISSNSASHYRYFSKLYAQQAKDADALAAHHEKLAEDYKSKSVNQ